MKKIICLILALCLSFCNYTIAFAKDENNSEKSINFTVFDEFYTDNYSVIGLKKGDSIYYITIENNGNIEFVKLTEEASIYSIWFTLGNLNYRNTNSNISLARRANDTSFINCIIEYGEKHATLSPISPESVKNSSNTRGYNIQDYYALLDELESIHGYEHFAYDWSGHSGEKYNGLTFYYNENLDYDMMYVDGINLPRGISLAMAVATIVGIGIPTTISVIAAVIDVANIATAVLQENKLIGCYIGSASYFRYVNINGSGPYCEGYKNIEYSGFVEENNPGSARLHEVGTNYSGTTANIFASYINQRNIAYNNY